MIQRCPELEVKFYNALRESFGPQTRPGIHLSALLNPKREFWQRAVPKAPTDEELGYFSAGRGHEDALTRFLSSDFKATDEAVIEGIHLRPDFEAITSRIIPAGEYAEFKTRRSNLPENDDEAATEFSNYRAQVRGYMALRRREQMYLVVLSLVEGKTGDPMSRSCPIFAIYVETMTSQELEAERRKLFARRESLLRAVAYHQLGVGFENQVRLELLTLPLCESWMCGKAYPEVKKKAVCQTCGQEFESAEFGPDKHVKSKKGAGHVVTPAVVEWTYIPRCKWYGECRPQDIDSQRGAR